LQMSGIWPKLISWPVKLVVKRIKGKEKLVFSLALVIVW
jgi:hypothetical protein